MVKFANIDNVIFLLMMVLLDIILIVLQPESPSYLTSS